MLTTLKYGLAGLGNVGMGVYKNLLKNGDLVAARTGVKLEVKRIAVNNKARHEAAGVPGELLTTDWRELVADPEIKVVVELIGGTTEALELVRAAMAAGKAVVTGNKALLAEHGRELVRMAEEANVPLYFEAAVAGGIPIIKAVREALIGNRILAIYGILNGTTNYILSRMSDAGLDYTTALAEAQAAGYAEADPYLDVSGWDAGHKAIVLAWLSYGHWVKPEDAHVEGIAHITQVDLHFAKAAGYAIRLLGVIRQDEAGCTEVRVQPCMVRRTSIIANINGVMNAIAVYGDIVGETLFYGSGAGQDATSSSVISDLADAADNLINEAGKNTGFVPFGSNGKALPVDATVSGYYLRLRVTDQPGVIAAISRVLADEGIGILSIQQPEVETSEAKADLMLMLHQAAYGKMRSAVARIKALDCIHGEPVLLRVEALPTKSS